MSKEGETKDIETIERRAALRLPVRIKFQYRIIDSSETAGDKINSSTKNVSCSGLLFESEKLIPIDTRIKLIISLPGSPVMHIDAEGKVVRIDKLSYNKFNIGVHFEVISDAQRDEIGKRIERMNIVKLLHEIHKREVSDVHLTVSSPPMIRCFGEIRPFNNESLTSEEIEQMVYSILTEEQRRRFESNKDLDFSFSPTPASRYRVSVYQQRGSTEVVFRNIMSNIKTREDLSLPDIIDELCKLKDGLVVIGGTTGSGKTTTITTMIDIINKRNGGVILSLEKPIEFLHENIKGIIKQREVGVDVSSFASGLKAALRQDPDVIVVGEVLDSDTIETALQAAETGHLVITSLHATDTIQVFDRIISFFPLDQRDFVYARLSHSLKAVMIQKLLPHKEGSGRVLATEVCVVNTAIRRAIYHGDFTQLPSMIQTGSKYKMHLLQDSIDRLFEQGLISGETYELHSKKHGDR